MKRFSYFVMGLISAAAFTFTSCSSSDDINGGTGKSDVDGFYMTMTIQTPTSDSKAKALTRTEENNTTEASKEESDVTSGTFYLTDANKNIVFSKTISAAEWNEAKIPTQGQTGKTQLLIPVQNVKEGVTYHVYFLANASSTAPWNATITAESKFAVPYANNNAFIMFNENDASVSADQYTVTFKEENKSTSNAAQVASPIKIERVTARIDQPTSAATTIKAYTPAAGETLTQAQKDAMADAVAKVKSIKLTNYAIANVAQSSYIMQQWNAGVLQMPATEYYQTTSEFGTATEKQDADFFTAINETTPHVDYVFENNATADPTKATTMYFEYTITLNDLGTTADAKDGTFYRYNGKIYNSIAKIYDDYKTQPLLFGGKTKEEVLSELKIDESGNVGASNTELSKFRKDYTIEVFKEGKAYYKQAIKDQHLNGGTENLIQRNSIYKLNVKNIFNLGADVPNGTPDDVKPMYYLDVEVSVNPWVLNTQEVEFK